MQLFTTTIVAITTQHVTGYGTIIRTSGYEPANQEV